MARRLFPHRRAATAYGIAVSIFQPCFHFKLMPSGVLDDHQSPKLEWSVMVREGMGFVVLFR